MQKRRSVFRLFQLIKYFIVGASNAILTGGVYLACLYIIKIHYLIALILAFSCGIFFTYFVNFIWVFRPESKFTFRHRFIKYLTSNLIIFSFNLVALFYIVERWDGDPFLSQAMLMVLIVAVNFLSAKYWSLSNSEPK
jgi:putative flippase GtrA